MAKRKVAVFDIDGTIFRSSLLLELVEALIQAKVFSKYAQAHYLDTWEKWRDREGSYHDFIMSVVEAYKHYIKGVRRADVWKVAERVIEIQKKRTYRYTRDLVKKLSKTHFLLAISHSPYEAVAPFAKSWGFEKVYAMVYEVDKKVRFTGKTMYEDIIFDKAKTLERALEHNNLTLVGSVGVGDTESDTSFLNMVEKPIAFNPSSDLYKVAKKKKWGIVVERKDVIYEL
jgi:HAD superfamily phosphoserine phosphatase-like hydrolase